ncbi:MAG: cupredoxin domain-containing protein [Candidatus Kerfeldbacteria bacterium]|nr:cupredoxin domain-containing protein [Candidatus Kerfeldbacteria bacterium]
MSKTILIVGIIVVLVLIGVIYGVGIVGKNNTKNANSVVANTTPAANVNLNRNAAVTNVNSSATNTNTVSNTNQATNTNTTNANTNAATEAKSVSVASSGFSPKTVQVKKGGSVTWTNNTSSTVYIAPNDHPTHIRYQGVWDDDGRGQIAPGETYTMTFTKTGTYGYHDHNDSLVTGTVVVE